MLALRVVQNQLLGATRLTTGEDALFACGDAIEGITGRDYDLSVDYGTRTIYPEVIQIVHLPQRQKTKLITRDLRFAEVVQSVT